MHETESIGTNYRFSSLENISLNCDLTGPLDQASAYVSVRGHLTENDKPIEVAGINHHKTSAVSTLSQSEVQELFIEKIAVGASLEEFVLGNINDNSIRQRHIQALQKYTHPFSYADEVVSLE